MRSPRAISAKQAFTSSCCSCKSGIHLERRFFKEFSKDSRLALSLTRSLLCPEQTVSP